MIKMTAKQMTAVKGGDCKGLRSLEVIAVLCGQPEVAAAALIVAIAEGCPL
ncbi:MAG: hypothetical protein ABJE47_12835 [bacterium]